MLWPTFVSAKGPQLLSALLLFAQIVGSSMKLGADSPSEFVIGDFQWITLEFFLISTAKRAVGETRPT